MRRCAMYEGIIWFWQKTGTWPPYGESHIECIDMTKTIFAAFTAFDDEAIKRHRGSL